MPPFLEAIGQLISAIIDDMPENQEIQSLISYLESQEQIELAWVFGSVASDTAKQQSDVDIAIRSKESLSTEIRQLLIEDIAELLGRPVDLIDYSSANPVLKRQFMINGKLIVNKNPNLYSESLKGLWFETQDWQPYRERILKERRQAWINS